MFDELYIHILYFSLFYYIILYFYYVCYILLYFTEFINTQIFVYDINKNMYTNIHNIQSIKIIAITLVYFSNSLLYKPSYPIDLLGYLSFDSSQTFACFSICFFFIWLHCLWGRGIRAKKKKFTKGEKQHPIVRFMNGCTCSCICVGVCRVCMYVCMYVHVHAELFT